MSSAIKKAKKRAAEELEAERLNDVEGDAKEAETQEGDSPEKIKKNGIKKTQKKRQTKQQRAQLILPISRINRLMKQKSGVKRIGGSAAVFLTAVLEYVSSEVLDLASEFCKEQKRKRVNPGDVLMAMRADSELQKLTASTAFVLGDKITGIGKRLMPKPLAKSA